MSKLISSLAKLFVLLAVLGALAYAAVLYWDKIMELVCRVKNSLHGKAFCCSDCGDECEDYAD